MSGNVSICDIHPDVIAAMKKFRHRKEKNIAAKLLKVDKASLTVILEEEFEDISIDDLREELPHQQPRYITLSYVYKHNDGRVSYPLLFVYLSPLGSSPELNMLYAGSKATVVKECQFTKIIEIRSAEDLTEETIINFVNKV